MLTARGIGVKTIQWAAAPALSGLLLMLAWPNPLWPGLGGWNHLLAWVALIPWLWSWRQSAPLQAAGSAMIMGLVYFTGTLEWLRLVNQTNNVSNLVAWLFFSFCGGLYFALTAGSARILSRRWPNSEYLVMPLAWVAWEYIRGHYLTGGWPWGSLGHSQYANPLLRQVAAVAGVGGVTYLLVLGNGALLNTAARLKRGGKLLGSGLTGWAWPKQATSMSWLGWGLRWLWLAIILITLLEMIFFLQQPAAPLRLSLLQGNINTLQDWDEAYKNRAMARMQRLQAEAAEKKTDLIVWAESCFPGVIGMESEKKWEEQLRRLIARFGFPTVLTSNEYQKEYTRAGVVYKHYNSAFYFDGSGQELGRYRKIRLVPFGEYIPFDFLKSALKTVVQEPLEMEFDPGEQFQVMPLKEHLFSILICYEDHFEELGHQFATQGSDFFLSLSNDGWAGLSAMSSQHTAMSIFLAVEHRDYMAKANMTGPTNFIDPWGSILFENDYFTPQVVTQTIYPRRYQTFFSRFGNLLPIFWTLLYFALFLLPAAKPPLILSPLSR
jgi:apolipoprotein N-acyltransferase